MRTGRIKLTLVILTAVTLTLSTAVLFSPTVKATPDQSTTTQSTVNNQSNSQPSKPKDNSNSLVNDDACSNLYGFGWLICPGQTLITKLVDSIMTGIDYLMKWTILAGPQSVKIQQIWHRFVAIANIIFAIAFVLMIYSMATSTGLSNYDIKTILPKLIIVSIAVNISFYLCAAAADLSNIVGAGVYDLIYTQTTKDTSAWTILSNVTGTAVGGAVLILLLFFFGGTVLVAVAVVLIALAFRSISLVVLVVVSPIALAMHVLPNTKKWADKWLNNFTSLLLVYPLFMATWAASRLVSNVFSQTADILNIVISFVCAIGPALAILPLLKATEGGVGSLVKQAQANSVAKWAKSGINNAGFRSAKDSQLANRARKWSSGVAMTAQNKFGNKPLVGGMFRSPSFNDLINKHSTYQANLDDQAAKSADNWLKHSGLSNRQQDDIIKNSGLYYQRYDAAGKGIPSTAVQLADVNKIAAATRARGGYLSYDDSLATVRATQAKANDLLRQGRQREAQILTNTLGDTMLKNRNAPLSIGGMVQFRNGDWSGQSAVELDKTMQRSTIDYANTLTPKAISEMFPHNQSSLRDRLSTIDPVSIANNPGDATEVNELNQKLTSGMDALRNNSNSVLASKMLKTSISAKGIETLKDNSWARTVSEKSQASVMTPTTAGYSVDQIVNLYITGNYNDAISSSLELMRDSSFIEQLSPKDRDLIATISKESLASPTPLPETPPSWR